MISQQVLFNQMEQQLQHAKLAQSEAKMREAISALQALCNVVLESAVSENPTVAAAPNYVQPATQLAQPSQPAKLDDANGHSIFDF